MCNKKECCSCIWFKFEKNYMPKSHFCGNIYSPKHDHPVKEMDSCDEHEFGSPGSGRLHIPEGF